MKIKDIKDIDKEWLKNWIGNLDVVEAILFSLMGTLVGGLTLFIIFALGGLLWMFIKSVFTWGGC